jgi:ABC-type transport system substrate-binding protein
MNRYILRRIFQMLPVLIGITIITFTFTEMSGATAFAALENGEIHLAGRVTDVEYERYKDDPNIVLLGGQLGGGMTVWANHNRPRWQDARVRQALLYALDREAMAEAYYGDLAEVLHIRLTNPEFVSPNITKYEYNPDKARALLEEAGWDRRRHKGGPRLLGWSCLGRSRLGERRFSPGLCLLWLVQPGSVAALTGL